jgi:hypothetical protein
MCAREEAPTEKCVQLRGIAIKLFHVEQFDFFNLTASVLLTWQTKLVQKRKKKSSQRRVHTRRNREMRGEEYFRLAQQ